jgi:PAS domain S-box-containing protein
MNSRTIVLMLALISLISTATGGYLYYHAAKKAAVIETERELAGTTNDLKDDIDRLISENQNQVRVMARFEQFHKAILNQDHASISQADQILDHFAGGLSYDVCYLMDGAGKIIASSNRNTKDSFVGHDYAFRPYFIDAIKGRPGVYLAVGVTSGMRGIFFSHPVYLPEGGLPIGVAVIKASTRELDKMLSRKKTGISLLVHSSGIIFASSRDDWTLKVLWKTSPEELLKIVETREFGKGPWNWSGLEEKTANQVVDDSGETYLIEEIGIGNLPGWRIVYLYSLRAIYGKIVDPLVGKSAQVAIFLCLLVGGAVLVLYVMAQNDIRSRKHAEQRLENSLSLLHSTLESTADGILVVDSKGKISAFNQRFLTLWQIPNDILESRDDEKAIAIVLDQLSDPEAFLEKVRYLYGRPEEGSFDLIEFKDGKIFERYSLPQKIGDTIVGRVWSFSDVTDRKRYEEQLRDSDEKTRLLVEQSPVGIAIFQDGKYRYANPELVKIFDCESDDQILGEPIIRFVAPGHQRLFLERCKRHIEGKSGRRSYQVEGIRRNGALFDMVLWPRKIDYGGQPAILAFVMDVTETKNLRNQLVRAQKMEAIGTLAGGIAHDFNNLLQVIVGYSELMMMNPALPDQFSRGIKSINKVAVNGAELVRRLLTFARKTESSAEPLNLNDKITQIRELLDRTLPKMIQIELKLSKDPTLINADASQIEQIIINLAVNAGHAMPEGGNLVIETKAVSLDRAYCLDHIEAAIGPYILLSVSDTGTGIDKKTLERIFEPFFTTKGPGIGTGLGLSMVYGIVKQHGGHVTCYSEPGAGATFKIYFPAIVSEVKSKKATDLIVQQGGTETILLVDDDENVLDVGKQMLIEYGYSVITASNGREALEIYSAKRETISLVILDLFMPEMGGKECLRALLRMDPKVSVLVASGFTQNGEIGEALDTGAKGFIGKPFDISQLLEEIRKIIDEE